jgi:hypothetical protein
MFKDLLWCLLGVAFIGFLFWLVDEPAALRSLI